MKRYIIILLLAPHLIFGQDNATINYRKELDWEKVNYEAKITGKGIFVDCFASWCTPCKQMEMNVLSKDSVVYYINKYFIPVRIQLDTTSNDDSNVRRWYGVAHRIQAENNIFELPTYLFFSSEGMLVHKSIGGKNVKEFISIIRNALDSNTQYYTLLKKYHSGVLSGATIKYLARLAVELKEQNIGEKIAREYMTRYLEPLPEDSFLLKSNLDFISSFYKMLISKDRVFNLFYYKTGKVDSIMSSTGYSITYLNYIINKENVTPEIERVRKLNLDPNWDSITTAIAGKYGIRYAIPIIVNAKVKWYKTAKDWDNYTKYLVQSVEIKGPRNIKSGMIGVLYLNNNAFEVFNYSFKKEELEKALTWIDLAIPMDDKLAPGMIDTKANILYKMGRQDEAIELEKKAISLNPKSIVMQETLDKMKRGEPTWADH